MPTYGPTIKSLDYISANEYFFKDGLTYTNLVYTTTDVHFT